MLTKPQIRRRGDNDAVAAILKTSGQHAYHRHAARLSSLCGMLGEGMFSTIFPALFRRNFQSRLGCGFMNGMKTQTYSLSSSTGCRTRSQFDQIGLTEGDIALSSQVTVTSSRHRHQAKASLVAIAEPLMLQDLPLQEFQFVERRLNVALDLLLSYLLKEGNEPRALSGE